MSSEINRREGDLEKPVATCALCGKTSSNPSEDMESDHTADCPYKKKLKLINYISGSLADEKLKSETRNYLQSLSPNESVSILEVLWEHKDNPREMVEIIKTFRDHESGSQT